VAGTFGTQIDVPGALPSTINQPSDIFLLPTGSVLFATRNEDAIMELRAP
jgi:hypothetical protein